MSARKRQTDIKMATAASKPSKVPAGITITQEQLVDIFTKSKASLVNFRHILLINDEAKEVAAASFHEEWSRSLLYGTGHEAFEGFRESAKDQYAVRSFMLYALRFPSTAWDYIVLIKNNSTLAENNLKEIAREYVQNPLLCSNLVRVNIQSGKVFEVVVKDAQEQERTVRIEAYGKGASVRGLAIRDKRPKIAIINDPQDTEDFTSITVQESDWEWFLADVMFLGQSCRIFLIGNNGGERCIIERVFNNASELGFKTRRIPVMQDGESTWPAKFSIEQIERERASYEAIGKLDIWLREKMCTAVSAENRIFDPADYRFFSPRTVHKIVEGCNLFATMDPARSTKQTGCYRAITVNAVDEQGYWFIVEIRYGRWPTSQHIDIIFDTVIRWKLQTFGIEKGEYLDVMEPFLRAEMAKRKVFFNIVPLEHGKAGSKLERIKMLSPRFKAHTIWFPENPVNQYPGEGNWLTEVKSELAGVTRDEIKSLFIDLADSLAMQEQIASVPFGSGGFIDGELPAAREAAYAHLPRYAEESEEI